MRMICEDWIPVCFIVRASDLKGCFRHVYYEECYRCPFKLWDETPLTDVRATVGDDNEQK